MVGPLAEGGERTLRPDCDGSRPYRTRMMLAQLGNDSSDINLVLNHLSGGTNVNVRSILVILVALLPASRFKNAALRRLGWKVGQRVDIGPCLMFRLDNAQIGDDVKIGPFNVFRSLARFELGEGAQFGQWN